MPMDKEKRNEYMRKYNKEYRKKNKEKTNKYFRIGHWKSRGLICEDYNKLYEYYLSIEECENCGIQLNQDEATRKCMDHCHETGLFRQILCKVCNTMRDKQRNELGQFI